MSRRESNASYQRKPVSGSSKRLLGLNAERFGRCPTPCGMEMAEWLLQIDSDPPASPPGRPPACVDSCWHVQHPFPAGTITPVINGVLDC